MSAFLVRFFLNKSVIQFIIIIKISQTKEGAGMLKSRGKSKSIKKLTFLAPDKIRLTVKDSSNVSGLAESIRHNGLLSPLTVRQTPYGYELVCGVRRYRACILAGIRKIPCLVVTADDKTAALMRVTENIHKSDTDVFLTAEKVDKVMREFNSSYHETAALLGISQPELMKLLGMLRFTQKEREEMKSRQYEKVLIKEEPKAHQNESPNSKIVSSDIRIFINSFNRIVAAMRNAGYSVKSVTSEVGESIEYSIITDKTPKTETAVFPFAQVGS